MTAPETEHLPDVYDATLVELGEADPSLVVVDADFYRPSRATRFRARFPDRFFDATVEDPSTIRTAVRLALEGKTVFATAFAVLAVGQGYHDLRQSVCRPRANVKLAANPDASLPEGEREGDRMVDDLGLLLGLPGMTIVYPSDGPTTRAATRAIASFRGPAYLRLTHADLPKVGDADFELGRARELRPGSDLTIASAGPILRRALESAEALHRVGIEARVLDLASLKPFDEKAILRAARETGAILTLEDHSVLTGLGTLVAAVTAEEHPVPVRRMGVPDLFVPAPTIPEAWDRFGLSNDRVLEEAYELLRARGKVE